MVKKRIKPKGFVEKERVATPPGSPKDTQPWRDHWDSLVEHGDLQSAEDNINAQFGVSASSKEYRKLKRTFTRPPGSPLPNSKEWTDYFHNVADFLQPIYDQSASGSDTTMSSSTSTKPSKNTRGK